jgi:Uma2 family endonuclease
MSTATPPLTEGQRLDQPTFHARYEATTPDFRAELVGGVVRLAGRVSYRHGQSTPPVIYWLAHYQGSTPGAEGLPHTTVILNRWNEPEPDVIFRLDPECGGSTREVGGYVTGSPELIVEVAESSHGSELGRKRQEYERAGVLEYVVWDLDRDEVIWHVLQEGRLVPVPPDADGLYPSRVFPGLWLDPAALLARDTRRLRAVVDLGVATPEHAAFVARLAAARGPV